MDEIENELRRTSENRKDNNVDITQSPPELLLNRIDKIEDLLWISDKGDMAITGKNLNDAQRIILYLIGVRYAFELGLIDCPEADSKEIARNAKVPFVAVKGWHWPLRNVIDKRHLELYERFEDSPFDRYQINMKNIDQALFYVTGEDDIPEPDHFL